ncbi:hypothetical protein CCHR01_08101 [Colletotrichum chrysophilum]|uniref:Uncharacterized protein n=1 Tax=Colletotrichum chrysophilum TaxID=1836956 RepID=A0AAD9AK98_9PEZI|nr:hypothetical protein CCHR01_08101 [Colletotrichum chrysophilum]
MGTTGTGEEEETGPRHGLQQVSSRTWRHTGHTLDTLPARATSEHFPASTHSDPGKAKQDTTRLVPSGQATGERAAAASSENEQLPARPPSRHEERAAHVTHSSSPQKQGEAKQSKDSETRDPGRITDDPRDAAAAQQLTQSDGRPRPERAFDVPLSRRKLSVLLATLHVHLAAGPPAWLCSTGRTEHSAA